MNEPPQDRPGDPQTLQGVIDGLERAGFTSQFGARAGTAIRCFACRGDFAPADATVDTVRRLEGASDPADMLAVLPLTCPRCGARGTLVLGFGPDAPIEDSEVLAALPQPEHPPASSPEQLPP